MSQKYRFNASIKQRLRPLTRLDNHHGLLAVLEDYLVLSCAIAAFFLSPYFYPLCLLTIGTRQRALATLLHESAHKTLCRNRSLNYLLGTTFSGHLIFQMYQPYLQSHVHFHHKHLGKAKVDPDFSFHQSEGLYDEQSHRHFRWKFLIKPWLFLNAHKHLAYLFNARFRVKTVRKKSAYTYELIQFSTLWAILATTATVFGLWLEILLLWLVPYLTTFQAINWYCELVEHFPMPDVDALDIEMTRNRFSPPIERFFLGIHGENYHLEHHLHPGIPFWRLANANTIRREDIHYDKLNTEMGGLITRSKTGAPSAISTIIQSLKKTPNSFNSPNVNSTQHT